MDKSTYYHPEQGFYQETIKIINKYVPKNFLHNKKPENLLAIPEFLALAKASPGILCIIDFPTRNYVFMSDNSKAIIGYEPEVFYKEGLEKTIGLFTSEQAEVILHKIFPRMFECIEFHCKEGNVKDIRLSFDSLVRNAEGSISWFLHQMTIIETDEFNNALLMLKLITDINDIKKDNNITFTISKKNKQGRYETIFSETYFPKAVEENLSSREVEILKLIDQGKTSKEISDLLFISTHTVKTHRKNMLKKMNINSTSALLKNIDQGSL